MWCGVASVLRVIDKCSTCPPKCKEFKSSITHHRPCCPPVFASMPPSPAQLALLVHVWHGAFCPRHARFVAFDGGRYHRRPPKEVWCTGQPAIVVGKQLRRGKALSAQTLMVEETMLSPYFTRPRTGRSGDDSR